MSACNMLLSVQLVADSGRPTLRSSGRGTQYCTTFGERSFGVSGPCLWNDLPNDLRNIGLPISTFGKHLKTQLFLLHDAAAHLWRFDFYEPYVSVLTYLLTYLLSLPVTAKHRVVQFQMSLAMDKILRQTGKRRVCFTRLLHLRGAT